MKIVALLLILFKLSVKILLELNSIAKVKLISKAEKVLERLKEMSKGGENLESTFKAQSELILIISKCLESEYINLDILRNILYINVEEISVDEMKKLTEILSIKILIRSTLAQVKVIKNSIYSNKEGLSEIVKRLSKISQALNIKTISLAELKNYLFILHDMKTMLDKALERIKNKP
jgi:hypothetical protein